MQHKIKEHFRGVPDEFMTSEIALKAKVKNCQIPINDNFYLSTCMILINRIEGKGSAGSKYS